MMYFKIYGMSCASCVAKVDKVIRDLPNTNINNVDINLLTSSMTVDAKTDCSAQIINAIKIAGYNAVLEKKATTFEKVTRNPFKIKFYLSLIILFPVLYLSSIDILGLPKVFVNSNMNTILCCLFTSIIMLVNYDLFTNGFKSLFKLAPNMNSLISIGASSAFIYSLIILIYPQSTTGHYYFESTAMILTIITLGKLLEFISKKKTIQALEQLNELLPDEATVEIDGDFKQITASKLKIEDVFIVKSGSQIPTDAMVLFGNASIDESCITGEIIPRDVTTGDLVHAATTCKEGFIRCKVTKIRNESMFAQIIDLVKNTTASKAPISRIADRICYYFVPIVIFIAILTSILWLVFGANIDQALSAFISVLVISCPCALGLATPVSIMVGTGIAAKSGILFKNATALELMSKINCLVFDKTGTLTEGKTTVYKVKIFNKTIFTNIMNYALSLEKMSEHPLSIAIVNEALKHNAKPLEVKNYKVFPGLGIYGEINSQKIYFGSEKLIHKFIGENINTPNYEAETNNNTDNTNVYMSIDGKIAALFCISDALRKNSKITLEKCRELKIETVMLTGANISNSNSIFKELSFNQIYKNILPNEKLNIIKSLQNKFTVAMVGDGINDTPALTQANIGIAIGCGSNIAIDSSDIILAHDDPYDILKAYSISKDVIKNIHQNLFFAFFYNFLCIPLAAGIMYPILGWQLNPILAALAMSLSSISVIGNALRLRLKLKINHKIKINTQNSKDGNKMKRIIHIKGMKCPHCEASVKDALLNIPNVEVLSVNHNTGTAIINIQPTVKEDIIIKQITMLNYQVTSIDNA